MYVNQDALARDKFVKKEIMRTLVIAPFETVFLLLVLYFTTGNNFPIFLIIVVFLIAFIFLFFVYAPYLMIKRHNSTICNLHLSDGYLIIHTFPILWLKEKKFQIHISNLQFKKSTFVWYGKNTPKEGLIININRKELYLVRDYIDNYFNVLEMLFK